MTCLQNWRACLWFTLIVVSVSCSPGEHPIAYLVEIWFWTCVASPERVVTSIPLREARRCSSCSPTATGKGSTSYTVHVRACVHFRKICDSVWAVRRLWGGLGQSRGAVGWWWGGGALGWCWSVIPSVIPSLSWSMCSSVLRTVS